jgi:hypothetical protein
VVDSNQESNKPISQEESEKWATDMAKRPKEKKGAVPSAALRAGEDILSQVAFTQPMTLHKDKSDKSDKDKNKSDKKGKGRTIEQEEEQEDRRGGNSPSFSSQSSSTSHEQESSVEKLEKMEARMIQLEQLLKARGEEEATDSKFVLSKRYTTFPFLSFLFLTNSNLT